MFHPCKVTVIRRALDKELVNGYLKHPEKMPICDRVDDGQEFIITSPYEMPEGICASAWADIRPYIITIATGGTFAFMKNKHSILASCTDLFRPVAFLIEKIENQ